VRHIGVLMGFGEKHRIVTLLGAAAAWSGPARAQQQAVALVGLLAGAQLDDRQIGAVRQGLKEAGYTEGRNVAIKYRSASGHFDQLSQLAAELVAEPVAAIFAAAPPATKAAKAATTTIPIVFVMGADPVALGVVSSLNRPAGNVTGVSFLVNELEAKRLELLREVVPKAVLYGLLVNRSNPSFEFQVRDAQQAAQSLGQQIQVQFASTENEIELAFASFVLHRVDAIIVASDQFFYSRRDQLVGLATRNRIPAIYHLREYVTAGGLVSYGTSISDAYRLAGIYTGRVLKGEKPADLPVQQSVKFELVLNLKTARALRLTVPDKLLAVADEVIE
jgi:putative tryptophan/tyrosine transport system substrate-binding protein